MIKLVEYYLLDSTINIFVSDGVISNSPLSIRVECSYRSLTDLITKFRNALLTCGKFETISDDLYDLLIEPISKRGLLIDGEDLYIAPHRCLHYVPFQALGTNDKLMLSKHSITYIPVGKLREYSSTIKREGTGCLVIKKKGDADNSFLRNSFDREADHVVRALNGELLSGNKATVDRIMQRVKGKRIVHFTCHGTFDQTDVNQSGLILADRQGRDEICDLATMSHIPFHVDLVVLAACDTGLSERHPGDELVGLVRALTIAGAKSIIATLWPVHTFSTEILIKKLYTELLSGKTKCESLKAAQSFLMSYSRNEIVEELRQEIESRGDKINSQENNLLVQRIEALNAGQNDRSICAPNLSREQLEGGKSSGDNMPYAHPYFWAPFVLFGGWK